MIAPAFSGPISEILSMATTGRSFTRATISLRMTATKHFLKEFAERPPDREACRPGPLIDRRDDAALERVERVADHRRVMTNGPSRNPALVEVGQRGASGVLLAPPASLKNTAATGTAAAYSPELTPPCEPHTTNCPASSGCRCAIVSIITTRPRGCSSSTRRRISKPPFTPRERLRALPQKRGHAIGHLTDHDNPPELRRGGPISRLA